MQNLWTDYKNFVYNSVFHNGENGAVAENIDSWKDKLFANAILYAFPISLFATIPSFLIAYYNELFNTFAAQGYMPSRVNSLSMPIIYNGKDNINSLTGRIKAAFDENNILSPKRYVS